MNEIVARRARSPFAPYESGRLSTRHGCEVTAVSWKRLIKHTLVKMARQRR